MIQIENGEENHKQQFTLKTLNMYIHAQKPNRRRYHNIYHHPHLFHVFMISSLQDKQICFTI